MNKNCTKCQSSVKVCNTSIGLLCGKHYLQYKRHGKILERTKYDLNDIILEKDYAKILLYNNKSELVDYTIVDLDDVNKIKNSKWSKDSNGYVRNSKQEYLHRFILEEFELHVDHINGNTLDNRKSNLRKCTNADNLKNRVRLPKNNTSGILGVRYRKDRNKWHTEIQYNNQKINLGSYQNKEDAIQARLAAEIKYFGEYKSNIIQNENN